MGLIADVLGLFERKVAFGVSVPTWEHHVPQVQRENYYRYALEGYARNEIVYACIDELCTSAAEPRIAAYKRVRGALEKLDTHDIVDLLERPNPFMDRFAFISTIIMHLYIAGNAYIEIVRSAAGRVRELWVLRPDRMFVVPDAREFVRGWKYRLGAQENEIPARDVIHIKMRNPLDDYYGMPPLAAAAMRVDTDNFMRTFTASFFRNAGVPAGMLEFDAKLTTAEKEMVQQRFRSDTAGPSSWHNVLILEQKSVKYTPMGMPLGERGLVLPELDEIDESRIAMVFGVPLILIGSRLGMQRSTFANYKEARASFWDETLMPLYSMIASRLNAMLVEEFIGVDEIQFDMSTVGALQEDEDAKHVRIREDVRAGLLSLQEGRQALGKDADFEPGAMLMLDNGVSPMLAEQLETVANDVANPPAALATPTSAQSTNGRAELPPDRFPALNGVA